jgi:hypothetical protein
VSAQEGGVGVGVEVGVGEITEVAVGVGVTTHVVQLLKSGSPKSGPPGPENSIKL